MLLVTTIPKTCFISQFSKVFSKRQNLSKKKRSGFLFCTNFAIRKCRLANDSARHDDVRGNGDLSQNSSFEGMNSQKILMQHPFFSFLQKDSKNKSGKNFSMGFVWMNHFLSDMGICMINEIREE